MYRRYVVAQSGRLTCRVALHVNINTYYISQHSSANLNVLLLQSS